MIRNSVNFNHFFFKKLKIINSCPKKFKHQQKKKSKKCVGLRYGSIVKNFTLTFCLKIFSWVLLMHRDSQKNWAKNPKENHPTFFVPSSFVHSRFATERCRNEKTARSGIIPQERLPNEWRGHFSVLSSSQSILRRLKPEIVRTTKNARSRVVPLP